MGRELRLAIRRLAKEPALAIAAVLTLALGIGACTAMSGPTDNIEVLAIGGSGLRYDNSAGQFIYNWQTPKKGGSAMW